MRYLLAILIALPLHLIAQIGGQLDYQALTLTSNPRAAALAGSAISLGDGDLSQFFDNPATLDSTAAGDVFLNINPYFADINVYSLAYSFDLKKMKRLAIGMQYLNLGSFQMTDETGTVLGTFSAADYVVSVGKSHQLGPLVLGANLKVASSSVDIYSTTAVLADIGGLFRVNKNWSVAMVLKNMGATVAHSNISRPMLPFDVRIGTSFKPEYMPLRFTVTTTNLVDRNFNTEEQTTGRSNNTIDMVLKRMNLGAELLLSDNFQVLFGYNHKRKQELRLQTLGGGAGFSFGLMARVKRFQVRYSRAIFHAAGGTSFISLQTNLNEFKKIL